MEESKEKEEYWKNRNASVKIVRLVTFSLDKKTSLEKIRTHFGRKRLEKHGVKLAVELSKRISSHSRRKKRPSVFFAEGFSRDALSMH